ncbi:MAG: hypothetical protein ACM30I_04305 [Gemmatimonas sp.]
MADEGPDETKLAEQINRPKAGERAERPAAGQEKPGRQKDERRGSARRPLHERRVHPESGGREPERDY